MIKLVRVDHRLLHGQVAFTWVKMIGTDCILIAMTALLRMSCGCQRFEWQNRIIQSW